MGWLDNLWRRRQDPTTYPERERAEVHTDEEARRDEKAVADALEEEAHRNRDEEIFREPRIPPGTG